MFRRRLTWNDTSENVSSGIRSCESQDLPAPTTQGPSPSSYNIIGWHVSVLMEADNPDEIMRKRRMLEDTLALA